MTPDLVNNLSSLTSAKSLQVLSIQNNTLGDDGFRHLLFFLRHCPSLSQLNASHNQITGKILPVVADYLGITVISLLCEENASCIRQIDISGTLIEPSVGESFRKLSEMSECTLIISVDEE